ncbi:protein ubiquitination [Pleodorina starrii]|uniref:Protein ubiquitination n=1 Tax=Pleodorina starrii TaxID=330485 RepID=A0A9W6F5C8_9CHLO|nr:protein ubiquitination [Pleodorina starrii]GLC57118.1 protein ubiquitination [Pleodorina starrii]GLC64952.1 protein ubiquitination [Pleodorina starrii]
MAADIDGDELERAFDEGAWDADEDGDSPDAANSQLNDSAQCIDATGEAAPAQQDVGNDARSLRAPHALLQLPREMLLRVLSLMPATGLTACACVCKTLAALASDDTIWRRLYIARWGKPSQQARGSTQWKRAYLDADGEEWEATTRGSGTGGSGPGADDPAMGAIFLDMLRAKRDTAPDRRQMDRHLEADPGDIAAKVAAWRRARGFADPGAGGGAAAASGSGGGPPPPPPRPDLSRRGRAALTFTRVNPGEQPPVYACDQTGWVHLCGDACTEGVVDARSELLVCPVSGQTTDRLVHECEEDEADGGRCGGGFGGGGAGEEEGGLGVFGGGFGSFFAAGYECENEKALNKLLGYKAL